MTTQLAVQQLERDRLPVVNDEIASEDNRYRLLQILGDGGYGTVFLSQNTQNRNVAVKTEKYSKSMLHIEVNGTCKPDYVYVVMTLLYKDLHKLRSELPDRKFSFSTALRLAIQTFSAIEELHSIGFISRDIKPGNFAPGHKATKQGKIIFMYDFGLARRYLDKNKNLVPSRNEVGWRGTTRYGSLVAHKRMDLSRRDDVESWFYMLIEITKGSLPWRLVTDRAQVYVAKQAAREGDGRKNFLSDTPPQYNSLLTWIDALVFEDTPPYSKFYNLLETVCSEQISRCRRIIEKLFQIREESKIRMYEHWDWEEDTSPITSISRTNSERN
uniref:Protein kinase domain-containing protein n=1 Tax=Angiostrongylus cantonensis TaxID=6313 RepID=A0A158P682_ANGCA